IEKGGFVLRMLGEAGYPDAGRHAQAEALAGEEVVRLDGAADSLGHLERATGVGPMQEDDVFVSPEADDDVVVAHAPFDDPRHLDQQLGADQVSVRVVDALEVVEVQEEKTEASFLLPALVDLPVEHQ